MKKTILAILMAMMMATTAYARLEGCTSKNGGKLFQGQNGQSYCLSRRTMNWWSAFSWCKSVGGELATVDDACPDTGFDTCTNIGINGTAWLATPENSDRAFYMYFSSFLPAGRTSTAYALCYQAPLLKTYEKTIVIVNLYVILGLFFLASF